MNDAIGIFALGGLEPELSPLLYVLKFHSQNAPMALLRIWVKYHESKQTKNSNCIIHVWSCSGYTVITKINDVKPTQPTLLLLGETYQTL